MFKKKEQRKVGRPKLADDKLKRESIIVCLFMFVTVSIFAFIGYSILTISFNPKYLVGTVYNDHINTCKISKREIDCGPNVSYIKYTTDGNTYKELTKGDKSIKVKLSNAGNVKVCYKISNNEKLNCIN